MLGKIDYRLIDEEVRKLLPGEVISQITAGGNDNERLHTTTQSSGNANFSLHGESWTIKSPTPEDIAAMLDGLVAPGNYFGILLGPKVEESNGYCAYVQTALLEDGESYRSEGLYMVEAQFIYDPDAKPTQYRTYANDVGEVKEIFNAFALGKVQDFVSWKDVTDEAHVGR
jgi:hypothetical protein